MQKLNRALQPFEAFGVGFGFGESRGENGKAKTKKRDDNNALLINEIFGRHGLGLKKSEDRAFGGFSRAGIDDPDYNAAKPPMPEAAFAGGLASVAMRD